MKVLYIKHSGFLVEDTNASYLFDYYDGEFPAVNEQKPLFCFASHAHYDHFSEKIFERTSHYLNVHYILSDDIPKEKIPQRCLLHTSFMKPDEEIDFKNIGVEISTLASTDQGVAFIVSSGGELIYHAGDLHDWIWEEEGEIYNREMEQAYLKEMKKISGFHFKVAFLPMDPRQSNESRLKGIKLFLHYASTEYLFPMHMWEQYNIAEEFLTSSEGRKYSEFIQVSKQNQQFEIE